MTSQEIFLKGSEKTLMSSCTREFEHNTDGFGDFTCASFSTSSNVTSGVSPSDRPSCLPRVATPMPCSAIRLLHSAVFSECSNYPESPRSPACIGDSPRTNIATHQPRRCCTKMVSPLFNTVVKMTTRLATKRMNKT